MVEHRYDGTALVEMMIVVEVPVAGHTTIEGWDTKITPAIEQEAKIDAYHKLRRYLADRDDSLPPHFFEDVTEDVRLVNWTVHESAPEPRA